MSSKGIGVLVLMGAMLATSGFALAADEITGDPYTLDHCVMSGKKFDEDTQPVVLNHEGREIKFCCNNCKGKFETDPAAVLSKLDAEITAQQKDKYPLKTCVVSGKEIKDGEGIDFVYNNRYFHLCCAGCKSKITADPAKYIGEVDAAVIKAQEGSYKIKTCPVSGEALGSMGDPVKMVVGNQLIELCCKGCTKKVKADPAKYIAMVQDTSERESKKN